MEKDHHSKNLKIAFILNVCFTIFEFIGGYITNSITIMSDAVHDLGDSFSLGSAWLLQKKSNNKPNNTYSFGYKRFSLLGALINAIILISGSIFIISEAITRIISPQQTSATGMLLFAIIGIIVNSYAAYKIAKGKTLNEKIVSWHLFEDVLGWVVVLIASIILQFKEIPLLDPILSLIITSYILFNVIKNLKKVLHLFLEGVPPEINYDKISNDLISLNNVESIHQLYIWSLDGDNNAFSVHIKAEKIESLKDVLFLKKRVREYLSVFNFKHITVEIDTDDDIDDSKV